MSKRNRNGPSVNSIEMSPVHGEDGCLVGAALGRVFIHGLQFDDVEKRVLRLASIHPRSSVSCAAITLRTRFTDFADHVAHSRPLVNTRPSAVVSAGASSSVVGL